jgi:site-specific recombinase XerD
LHVREGKGCKERLIPYGELSGALAIVDSWLTAAGITAGRVFRSFWRGNKRTRGALSVRAVELILASYPIMVGGVLRTVKPHDCRRTYALLCWKSGMKLEAIQHNLGHGDPKLTELYIGLSELSEERKPAGFLDFQLTNLPKLLL